MDLTTGYLLLEDVADSSQLRHVESGGGCAAHGPRRSGLISGQ